MRGIVDGHGVNDDNWDWRSALLLQTSIILLIVPTRMGFRALDLEFRGVRLATVNPTVAALKTRLLRLFGSP